MELENIVGSERLSARAKRYRRTHRLDIAYDFSGETPCATWIDERLSQSSVTHTNALDATRRDRLRSKQREGDCLDN